MGEEQKVRQSNLTSLFSYLKKIIVLMLEREREREIISIDLERVKVTVI